MMRPNSAIYSNKHFGMIDIIEINVHIIYLYACIYVGPASPAHFRVTWLCQGCTARILDET